MECHGNVMEFCFSGKVMEMSWNFTKMSWKKNVFTNSVVKIWYYVLNNYVLKNVRLRRNFIFWNIYKNCARAFGARIYDVSFNMNIARLCHVARTSVWASFFKLAFFG